jgi:hypothetical protein
MHCIQQEPANLNSSSQILSYRIEQGMHLLLMYDFCNIHEQLSKVCIQFLIYHEDLPKLKVLSSVDILLILLIKMHAYFRDDTVAIGFECFSLIR